MQTSLRISIPKLNRIPFLAAIIKKILCLKKFNKLYIHVQKHNMNTAESLNYVLEALQIKFNYCVTQLDSIPKTGPVIVVANHPFGGIEGIALADMLLKLRPDTKVVANHLLKNFQPIADLFIPVDAFAKKTNKLNICGMKMAQSHLSKQGLLCMFPAGVVSHWHWRRKQITDSEWNTSIARLAILTQATIVPVYFFGRNSWYFQFAGLISSYLRTLLLPQQFFAKQNMILKTSIGQSIAAKRLNKLINSEQQINYLRLKTYLLQYKNTDAIIERKFAVLPIAETNTEILIRELKNLPSNACLVEQNEFEVYLSSAKMIPSILREITRLREITFRAAGEGTGKSADEDKYDAYYLHLFVWHKTNNKIIGAYRIGLTDKILPEQGISGMYISSLYKVSNDFFEKIYPAIELGRSFIITEYQKHPLPLVLLWKAIARFLQLNSHYLSFYGLVTISNSYTQLSKDLMITFLNKYYTQDQFASVIKAQLPYKLSINLEKSLPEFSDCNDLLQLDELIREIENNKKGIPILLKHYLKMQAFILAFNRDQQFNNCVDCLCMSYIKDIPKKKLQYYTGRTWSIDIS